MRGRSVLSVSDGRYFLGGDVIRNPKTGETYHVTAAHGGEPRSRKRIGFWRATWDWLHGEPWSRVRIVDWFGHTVRVYPHRPTGLKRRLP